MAFADLNFKEAVWSAQGLKYILLPEDAAISLYTPRSGSKLREIPKFSRNEAQKFVRQEVQKPIQPTPDPAIPRPDAPPASPRVRTVPQEEWPKPWADLLARTSRGKLAWTYWQLGSDLLPGQMDGGQEEARKNRGAFMRQFFRDLGYGKGTHTFWPSALPDQETGEMTFSSDIFWSGLRRLGCRGSIVMGSEAAGRLLGTVNLKPMTARMVDGQRVWILWSIDTLLASPETYKRALGFLRRALKLLGI